MKVFAIYACAEKEKGTERVEEIFFIGVNTY